MSDGYSNSWQNTRNDSSVKDASGRALYANDPVWIAGEEGQFIKATIIEILPEGTILLMTKSSSIIELDFKPKVNASSNLILKS